MCLPLKCLKCWVTFSAVLCLILGVVAAIVAGVQMSGVAKEQLPEQFANMASGATYAFLAFGILLILIGIAGIIGSIKNIDCCLHIYNIGNCIFFVIFLILAIVLFAAVAGLGNMRDQKECENSTIFGQWDKWERTAYNTLCTDACKCKVYKNSPLIAQATPANLNRKAPFVYEGVDKPVAQQSAPAPSNTSAVNVSTTAKFSEFAEIVSFQAAANATNATNATKELSPVRFQQCSDYDRAIKGGWTVSESGNSLKWTQLKSAAPAANASSNSTAPKRFLQAAAAAAATANASSNASANATPAAGPYVSAPLNYNISDRIQGSLAETFFGSMRLFEDNLECAGVCQKRLFYTFSNVNDHEGGAPKDSCGGLLYDGIARLGRIIAIVSILIALFLLLNVILAYCLTKQNDQESK